MAGLWLCLLAAAVAGGPRPCPAAEPADGADAVRGELLALREAVIRAYEARDIEAVLAHVHPEVIATWQNGFRARGRDAVRKFFNDMMTGESRIVRDVKSRLEVDGAAIRHGDDAAVACGTLSDDFDLASGSRLHLESKWTATLIRLDGRWLIGSFHVSASIFENAVLDAVRSWATRLAVGLGVVGLLVGAAAGRLLARRRSV
jgi:uncharacterized protein (TIGR02246 family)